MNIGIVTTWFERGAAYVSKQFHDTLSENNNVFVYVRGGESYAKKDPKWLVENLYWGKKNPFFVTTEIDLSDFKNWVLENRIEIVIFNEQQQWDSVILCAELNVICGSYIDYYQKETVPLHSIYDFLICNTKRHYSVFDWHKQAYYIPWGTEINIFKPVDRNRNEVRKSVTFFHSCGMNPKRKGTDLLIKAMKTIKSQNYKVIIHSQVDLKIALPSLAKDIRRFENCKLLKVIHKTVGAPGLYHLGDVYIYPTRLEGIGLTIAEALSCELPVITTNQAPMNEFVVHGKNGMLVDVDHEEVRDDNYYWPMSICSIPSLALSMQWYIDNKKSIGIYKNQARQYVKRELNWHENSKDFSNLLLKTKKIDIEQKLEAIKQAKDYESKRPIIYYLNTFKPYKTIKKVLKWVISKT